MSGSLSGSSSDPPASWSEGEDTRLLDLMREQGSAQWPAIATAFPGRGVAECRLRWDLLLEEQLLLAREIQNATRKAAHEAQRSLDELSAQLSLVRNQAKSILQCIARPYMCTLSGTTVRNVSRAKPNPTGSFLALS